MDAGPATAFGGHAGEERSEGGKICAHDADAAFCGAPKAGWDVRVCEKVG